jgi:hypothetical protein
LIARCERPIGTAPAREKRCGVAAIRNGDFFPGAGKKAGKRKNRDWSFNGARSSPPREGQSAWAGDQFPVLREYLQFRRGGMEPQRRGGAEKKIAHQGASVPLRLCASAPPRFNNISSLLQGKKQGNGETSLVFADSPPPPSLFELRRTSRGSSRVARGWIRWRAKRKGENCPGAWRYLGVSAVQPRIFPGAGKNAGNEKRCSTSRAERTLAPAR